MHESEESGQPRVVLNVRAVEQWVVGLSTLSSRAAKSGFILSKSAR